MSFHDPNRQISYLQQCLANDKKPIAFFLGAGCPMAIRTADNQPLIPDIAGITKAVRVKLAQSKDYAQLLTTLEANFTADGINEPNVEFMLSHIRSLKVVAGKEKVRGLAATELDALDKGVCDFVQEVVNRSHISASSPYHCIADWINAIAREQPIEVFTTNYDLLMEQALESSGTPYFDGFSGVSRPFFDLQAIEEDILPPRWARLWKLHGSINWFQAPRTGVFRSASRPDDSAIRLIHPSHLKYDESRRMPYLVMLDRLRSFLKQPTSALIVSGYSFRDDHLNEVILQGLQRSPSAICFALLFGSLDQYEQAVALANKRPNLSLLASDGGVISGVRGSWIERAEESDLPDLGRWLKWEPKVPEKPKEGHCMRLQLGDFAAFGEFLRTLAGVRSEGIEELTNAK
jgi:hypothetical protein